MAFVILHQAKHFERLCGLQKALQAILRHGGFACVRVLHDETEIHVADAFEVDHRVLLAARKQFLRPEKGEVKKICDFVYRKSAKASRYLKEQTRRCQDQAVSID